jgi:hypothetical protein
MPVNSSSPASVVPGVSPLAAMAAASQSSAAAIVSVMTCWRRSARALASVRAQVPAWSATSLTMASRADVSSGVVAVPVSSVVAA